MYTCNEVKAGKAKCANCRYFMDKLKTCREDTDEMFGYRELYPDIRPLSFVPRF